MTDTLKKEIKFLIVTDIHHKQSNLEKIPKQFIENSDFVLCLGDIGNLFDADQEDESLVNVTGEYIDYVRNFFSNKPYYYIPGNHDRKIDYDPEKSFSCHKTVVDINERLFLACFGGSVPAFYNNGNMAFDGYPYKSDNELSIDLNILRSIVEENLGVNGDNDIQSNNILKKQIILMTHCGPIESHTTEFRKSIHDEPFPSGSKSISDWLLMNYMQENCVINVHGHTHPGRGQSTIGNIVILNPGPFVEGKFAFVTLVYNDSTEKYEVRSTELHNISMKL